MGRNVAAGTFMTVSIDPVKQFLQRLREARRPGFHAIEHFPVLQQNANQRYQVIAGPESMHVGLATANRTAESDLAIKPGVLDLDMCTQQGIVALTKPILISTIRQMNAAHFERL